MSRLSIVVDRHSARVELGWDEFPHLSKEYNTEKARKQLNIMLVRIAIGSLQNLGILKLG